MAFIMSQSLRSHFLISATHLRDTNFYKSVILLIEHNKDGAMGVIINRPLNLKVHSALEKHFDIPESKQCIYSGGPVEPAALLVMHNEDSLADDVTNILSGANVGTHESIFDRIADSIRNPEDPFRFRLYAGYSGWSKGQLEGEIERGDWYRLPGDASYVFCDDPYEVWEELLRKVHEDIGVITDPQQKHEWN